jgi:hypothetical protein
MRTMRVEYFSSETVGQEDFLSSWTISREKFFIVLKGFFMRAVAGEEGLEPPTYGFGDRCSTN